jgi:hypothetical protein
MDVYKAGDIEGYAFAWDAAGKDIDWAPVVRKAAQSPAVVEVDLSMLFRKTGKVRQSATVRVNIPAGADEKTVRQRVYSAIRTYTKEVGERMAKAEQEQSERAARRQDADDDEDDDDQGDAYEDEYDVDGDDGDADKYEDAVALLSAVRVG